MTRSKQRAAQALAGMALIGLLLVSAPATACVRSHHGGMMGSAANEPQDPVVASSDRATAEIRGFDFVPRDLTVPAGATVTWVNRDNVPHDATDRGGEWATGMLEQGDQASVLFGEQGAFEYTCSIHPDMTAKLVVRADPAVQDEPWTAGADRPVSVNQRAGLRADLVGGGGMKGEA